MTDYQFYAEIDGIRYTDRFFAVDRATFYMLCGEVKVYETREYCHQGSKLEDGDIPAWYLEECVEKSKVWVEKTIPEFLELLKENDR